MRSSRVNIGTKEPLKPSKSLISNEVMSDVSFEVSEGELSQSVAITPEAEAKGSETAQDSGFREILSMLEPYEAIIFSLGDVILSWDSAHATSTKEGVSEMKEIVNHPIWRDLEQGLISRNLELKLLSSEPQIPCNKLREILNVSTAGLQDNRTFFILLRTLFQRNKKILRLSNVDFESFLHLCKKIDSRKYFENIYAPVLLQYRKPSSDIFKYVVSGFSKEKLSAVVILHPLGSLPDYITDAVVREILRHGGKIKFRWLYYNNETRFLDSPDGLDTISMVFSFLIGNRKIKNDDVHFLANNPIINRDEGEITQVYFGQFEVELDVNAAASLLLLSSQAGLRSRAKLAKTERFLFRFLTRKKCLEGARYFPSPDVFLFFLSRLIANYLGRFRELLRPPTELRISRVDVISFALKAMNSMR